MSKQRTRRQPRPSASGPAAPSFTPVPVRPRHDGWTPLRQDAFVKALAACANIEEACAAVGMSPRSYYDLRSRPDAGSFRAVVDAALTHGIERLADAMLGRALHGESTPIFYKGEQVGERRRFDNRLGMFILRTRLPERYGKWRDHMKVTRRHPDGPAWLFEQARCALRDDLLADEAGQPRPERPLEPREWHLDDPEHRAAFDAAEDARREEAVRRDADARNEAFMRTLDLQTRSGRFDHDSAQDVPRRS